VDEDDLFRTQSWVGGCEVLEGASGRGSCSKWHSDDGGVNSLGMLPTIVDAVWEELEIFFDSGIRCEADIAKALALALGASVV
jgi:isopentenyl diphosphate isomerase/L-lactate dehydrogenase-like FMN-dependent dehydrogenase